jgi:hypothetical protein
VCGPVSIVIRGKDKEYVYAANLSRAVTCFEHVTRTAGVHNATQQQESVQSNPQTTLHAPADACGSLDSPLLETAAQVRSCFSAAARWGSQRRELDQGAVDLLLCGVVDAWVAASRRVVAWAGSRRRQLSKGASRAALGLGGCLGLWVCW